MSDWSDDPRAAEWIRATRAQLPQMIDDSSLCISIVPENAMKTDVKFAVELGFMIMMDKPIVAVVRPGTKVPNKLVLVADEIIECNMEDEHDRELLAAALKRFNEQIK